jgi:hypothetical protein
MVGIIVLILFGALTVFIVHIEKEKPQRERRFKRIKRYVKRRV